MQGAWQGHGLGCFQLLVSLSSAQGSSWLASPRAPSACHSAGGAGLVPARTPLSPWGGAPWQLEPAHHGQQAGSPLRGRILGRGTNARRPLQGLRQGRRNELDQRGPYPGLSAPTAGSVPLPLLGRGCHGQAAPVAPSSARKAASDAEQPPWEGSRGRDDPVEVSGGPAAQATVLSCKRGACQGGLDPPRHFLSSPLQPPLVDFGGRHGIGRPGGSQEGDWRRGLNQGGVENDWQSHGGHPDLQGGGKRLQDQR